jgi:hypothetical protein
MKIAVLNAASIKSPVCRKRAETPICDKTRALSWPFLRLRAGNVNARRITGLLRVGAIGIAGGNEQVPALLSIAELPCGNARRPNRVIMIGATATETTDAAAICGGHSGDGRKRPWVGAAMRPVIRSAPANSRSRPTSNPRCRNSTPEEPAASIAAGSLRFDED